MPSGPGGRTGKSTFAFVARGAPTCQVDAVEQQGFVGRLTLESGRHFRRHRWERHLRPNNTSARARRDPQASTWPRTAAQRFVYPSLNLFKSSGLAAAAFFLSDDAFFCGPGKAKQSKVASAAAAAAAQSEAAAGPDLLAACLLLLRHDGTERAEARSLPRRRKKKRRAAQTQNHHRVLILSSFFLLSFFFLSFFFFLLSFFLLLLLTTQNSSFFGPVEFPILAVLFSSFFSLLSVLPALRRRWR